MSLPESDIYVLARPNVVTERNISNVTKGETLCTKFLSNLEHNSEPGLIKRMKNIIFYVIVETINLIFLSLCSLNSKIKNKFVMSQKVVLN